MSFIVRSLILHHGIELPANGPAPDGTSEILEYRSNVGRTDLEPDPADHLRDGIHVTSIPAGLYLFAQGILEPGTTEQPAIEREKAFRDAAEAVWLESLWQEKPLKTTGSSCGSCWKTQIRFFRFSEKFEARAGTVTSHS